MKVNMQVVKWFVNLMLGIVFLCSMVTGMVKFTLFIRTFGLTDLVLPSAFLSDIHDWSGITLCLLVAVHLFLNRTWILSMTKKVVTGTTDIK
jgi:hypothetical protein